MKRTSTLHAAIIALAGCTTLNQNPSPVRPPSLTAQNKPDAPSIFKINYVPASGPIRVNRDNQDGNSLKFDVYENIKEEDIEKQLVRLAQTAEYEDSWVYSTNQKKLFEIGMDETPFQTKKTCLPTNVFEAGDHLVFYHQHCLLTAARAFKKAFPQMGADELEDLLNDPSAFYSLASIGDVEFLEKRAKELARKGITVETRIADHQYLTQAEINPDSYEKLQNPRWKKTILDGTKAYFSKEAPFETLLQAYTDIGLKIKSRKLDQRRVKVEMKDGKLERAYLAD